MVKFLAIQHNYNGLEVALFQDETLIAHTNEDKIRTSKNILICIDNLLGENQVKLEEISFIAINQGPGPFTTLRVIISTVNGISFASNIPLIGIDGIKAILNEYNKPEHTTVALLNAYSKDVYFGFTHPESKKVLTGYDNIDNFLKEIHVQFPSEKLYFIGNGADLYKEKIEEKTNNHLLKSAIPQMCSIKQIGKEALSSWQSEQFEKVNQLLPLYLKQGTYQQTTK